MSGRRLNPWIGILFAIGSVCFFVGPFPGFINLVGSEADGVTFFVGSIFFTAAAFLQCLQTANAAALVQLAGTVFFNISTFHAMADALDTESVNRLVWAPDVFGSICFLVSGVLAFI